MALLALREREREREAREGDRMSAELIQIRAEMDQIQKQNMGLEKHMKEIALNQAEFENKIMTQINVTLRDFKDEQVKSNTLHFKNITDQLCEAHQENMDSSTVILTKITEESNRDDLRHLLSDNRELLIHLKEAVKGYDSSVLNVHATPQKYESQLAKTGAKLISIQESLNQLGAEIANTKVSSHQFGADLATIKESCHQFGAHLATIKESSHQFGADLQRINELLSVHDRNVFLKTLSEQLEAIKKYLAGVEKVPDAVKTMTRDYFVWLNNEIEKKFDKNVRDLQENLELIKETYKKVDSIHTSFSTMSEEILVCKLNNGNQYSADRQQMQSMAKPYFEQDINNVLSALEKLGEHLEDKIRGYGNDTMQCLKQFDMLHNLNKRFTQISDTTKELKAMIQQQTTSVDTGACLTELFNRVNTLIPDVHQHFQVNIQEEWRILKELISRQLTDATQTLSNATVTYTDEIVKQTKGNSSALRKEVSCIAEASNDIFASIFSLQENTEAIQSQVKDVETTVKKLQTNVSSLETCVKEEIRLLTKKQTEAMEKQEKSFSEVKDFIERTKHEIFAMSEKEAQLVRDKMDGSLPSPGKYTFDFYVSDFKSLVRSGKTLRSTPWYINEIKSSVSGCVSFSPDGKMEVSLVPGRHPSAVGLKPVNCKEILKVTATICDVHNRTLPELAVFQKVLWNHDEASIPGPVQAGWNKKVGTLSCDDLVQKGYGDREGYHHAALLIRYDVIVVSSVS